MAGGFPVPEDKLVLLRELLVERLGDGFASERLVPELAFDGALSVAATQSGVLDHVAALAPFGAANPEPRFAFSGVQVAFVESVGTGHLRCTLADPIGPARLKAIAFRVAETPLGEFLAASRGRAIHVAGHLRRDDYRCGESVQLTVVGAAPVDP